MAVSKVMLQSHAMDRGAFSWGCLTGAIAVIALCGLLIWAGAFMLIG